MKIKLLFLIISFIAITNAQSISIANVNFHLGMSITEAINSLNGNSFYTYTLDEDSTILFIWENFYRKNALSKGQPAGNLFFDKVKKKLEIAEKIWYDDNDDQGKLVELLYFLLKKYNGDNFNSNISLR